MTEKQSDLYELMFPAKNDGPVAEPEVILWQSVLIVALNDADNLDNPDKRRQRHAKEAIRWLVGNSEDFATVCDLAREEPDYACMRFKQWLANRYPPTLLGNVFASHD